MSTNITSNQSNTNQLYIREAQKNDLSSLIELGSKGWEEQITKEFSERFEKKIVYLVAELNGEIVGQIIVWEKGKQGKPYLSALRVLESYRSRGIGTQLIKSAENFLKDKGATIIQIAVDIDNEGALRLYRDLGYQQLGEEYTELWSRTSQGKTIEYETKMINLEKLV